jgi:signal transduction histidine kinase
MSAFLDPAALTTMRLRLQRMKETGEQLTPLEYPGTRRDGSTITVEISSIFIEFEGCPAVLAFARDVTERSRLRAQLAHADRLASLGMMAAGVAHEINNPLAFVMLAADMLEHGTQTGLDPEQYKDLVHNIQTGVRRVAAIVRDLRTFGRYEDEPPGNVDLAATFESAVSITAHEVRPRARLRREHGELPPVLGVAMRLEQVFVNLLLNAAHSIAEDRNDGEILISATTRDLDVVVEVTDNGDGIPPELLPHIFEPFVTTKLAGEGVGLGLSICRDIVARSGGRIEAESTRGKGTTLRVTLPRATHAGAPDRAARLGEGPHEATETSETAALATGTSALGAMDPVEPASQIAPSGVRRHILVIDDEPLTVAMTIAALRDAHDVVGETDPAVGLDRILAEPTFDLILCDLMMPGVSGMDIYERVHRERPGFEQRMVFISGGPYTQRARKFLESVPNRRLVKPLSISSLLSLVNRP